MQPSDAFANNKPNFACMYNTPFIPFEDDSCCGSDAPQTKPVHHTHTPLSTYQGAHERSMTAPNHAFASPPCVNFCPVHAI